MSKLETRMNPLPIAWIEKLFGRFSAMYGNNFMDMCRGMDLQSVKGAWAEDLAGYTGEEIKRGVEWCKRQAWPPSLPEFLSACRPPIEHERAYHEAVEQMRKRTRDGSDTWSHKAIFYAARAVGSYDLANSTWGAIKGRWCRALDEMLAETSLPEIPKFEPGKALPPPPKTQVSKDEAEKRVEALQIQIGSKPTRASVIARWVKVLQEKHSTAGMTLARQALKELGAKPAELVAAGMEEEQAHEWMKAA